MNSLNIIAVKIISKEAVIWLHTFNLDTYAVIAFKKVPNHQDVKKVFHLHHEFLSVTMAETTGANMNRQYFSRTDIAGLSAHLLTDLITYYYKITRKPKKSRRKNIKNLFAIQNSSDFMKCKKFFNGKKLSIS